MWFSEAGSGTGLYNGSKYLCGIAAYSKGIYVSAGQSNTNDAMLIWVTPTALTYSAFRNGANWTHYKQLS